MRCRLRETVTFAIMLYLILSLPLRSSAEIVRMPLEQLKALIDQGAEVIVVDVRSHASYEAGHIPGALSIPLDEIPDRQGELPRDKQLVLY